MGSRYTADENNKLHAMIENNSNMAEGKELNNVDLAQYAIDLGLFPNRSVGGLSQQIRKLKNPEEIAAEQKDADEELNNPEASYWETKYNSTREVLNGILDAFYEGATLYQLGDRTMLNYKIYNVREAIRTADPNRWARKIEELEIAEQ